MPLRQSAIRNPKSAILLVALALVVWWLLRPAAGPHIPTLLAAALPANCQQVVLVLTADEHSHDARLWCLERSPWSSWRQVGQVIPVTWGEEGLAWGTGERTAAPPTGFRVKREGDMCSPAGVFRIPFAFGQGPADQATWLKLPYTPLTPTIVGVDDPKSSHYNQVVDNSKVAIDWDSNEPMSRREHLYQWGAFIANNPQRIPGLGSCIFFHLWPGPDHGTSGCTAMSEDNLKSVLAWLDPQKEPRLVQAVVGW